MKLLKIIPAIMFVAGFILGCSGSLSAQDIVKEQKTKTITIVVDDGENGDTTILYSGDFNGDEFLKAQQIFRDQMKDLHSGEFHIKEYQQAIQEFEDQMELMEDQLGDMELELDLEDFEWADSPRLPRVYCHPEVEKEMQRIHRMPREETLSDVIGRIPMSAVKSYRVKPTKEGKKIYIEVMDDRMLRDIEKDVIILRR
jgi:hypothetical protein